MKYHINLLLHLGSTRINVSCYPAFLSFPYGSLVAHRIVTGAQLASRGRRDMSSRVRDVVVSLGLCHNVSADCRLYQSR